MRLSFAQGRVVIAITEPRSRCANRKVRGQAHPPFATTSGWQPTVSEPKDCSGCATLISDTSSDTASDPSRQGS